MGLHVRGLVRKCGNLVSTGLAFDPGVTATVEHAGHCFAYHDRIEFSFHSNVLQCPGQTRCLHLRATLSLTSVCPCGHAGELLTKATTGVICSKGFLLQRDRAHRPPLHLCEPTYLLSPRSIKCTARYLQFQWKLPLRVNSVRILIGLPLRSD